jgi:sigma-B regulation protein RsbU (phosphoserine phosphatase)
VRLAPGDTLIAFSDGVTETLNVAGDEFSDERLVNIVRNHAHESVNQLTDRILAEWRDFSGGATQADDVSLLVFRYMPQPAKSP